MHLNKVQMSFHDSPLISFNTQCVNRVINIKLSACVVLIVNQILLCHALHMFLSRRNNYINIVIDEKNSSFYYEGNVVTFSSWISCQR